MSEKNEEKIFLLCVGAHKAGTTWLHRYLENHKNVDLGFLKEYHVFDSLVSPTGEWKFDEYIGVGQRKILSIKRKMNHISEKRRSIGRNIFKILDFFVDYDNYFDFFAGILHMRNDILLTGDMTPAYSSLEPQVFEVIKNGFYERGVTVKVIFLMRDPVERCVSACQGQLGRKQRRRMERNDPRALAPVDFDEYVGKCYRTAEFDARGRYDSTILNLEKVFPDSSIHFEFYERLFNQDSVTKICHFLGLTEIPANFSEKINESSVEVKISNKLRAEIRAYYGDLYEFMYKRYSKDFIDGIWESGAGVL